MGRSPVCAIEIEALKQKAKEQLEKAGFAVDYVEIADAFAKGEFFNTHIRTRYPATRLDDPQPSLFDRSDRPEE